MVVVVALLAALFLGVGFVQQQRVAATAPESDSLSLRLLRDLVVQPRWLLGMGTMVLGQVLGAYAFSLGEVALVEPLLALNLLVALAVARRGSGCRIRRREWAGALALAAGCVLFLLAARPEAATSATAGAQRRWATIGAVLGLAAILLAEGRRREGRGRAVLLAGAAGTLYGLQDCLTRWCSLLLDDGLRALVLRWQPYLLVGVAVVGLVAVQSAFGAAPLRVSLPVVNAAEPLAGIAVGLGVLGGQVALSPPAVVGELAGLVAMVAGATLVARSPVLTSTAQQRERRERQEVS